MAHPLACGRAWPCDAPPLAFDAGHQLALEMDCSDLDAQLRSRQVPGPRRHHAMGRELNKVRALIATIDARREAEEERATEDACRSGRRRRGSKTHDAAPFAMPYDRFHQVSVEDESALAMVHLYILVRSLLTDTFTFFFVAVLEDCSCLSGTLNLRR